MKRIFINQTDDFNARSSEKDFATKEESIKEIEEYIREKIQKGDSDVSDLTAVSEKPVSIIKEVVGGVFEGIIQNIDF